MSTLRPRPCFDPVLHVQETTRTALVCAYCVDTMMSVHYTWTVSMGCIFAVSCCIAFYLCDSSHDGLGVMSVQDCAIHGRHSDARMLGETRCPDIIQVPKRAKRGMALRESPHFYNADNAGWLVQVRRRHGSVTPVRQSSQGRSRPVELPSTSQSVVWLNDVCGTSTCPARTNRRSSAMYQA